MDARPRCNTLNRTQCFDSRGYGISNFTLIHKSIQAKISLSVKRIEQFQSPENIKVVYTRKRTQTCVALKRSEQPIITTLLTCHMCSSAIAYINVNGHWWCLYKCAHCTLHTGEFRKALISRAQFDVTYQAKTFDLCFHHSLQRHSCIEIQAYLCFLQLHHHPAGRANNK